jgi:hypothetical protein
LPVNPDIKLPIQVPLLLGRRLHLSLGITPTWLVNQVHTEPMAQAYRLETFATIGCGCSNLGELARAMPHDNGQFSGINRNLVKGVGMIAMVGLPSGAKGLRGSTVPGAVVSSSYGGR